MPEDYPTTFTRLADLLSRVPLMKHAEGRQAVLEHVRKWFPSLAAQPVANDRIHCINILNAVLQEPGALQCLATKLPWLSEYNDLATAFADEVTAVLPCDFLILHDWVDFAAAIHRLAAPADLAHYYRAATGEVAERDFGNSDELIRELAELDFADLPHHPLILLCEAIANRERGRPARAAARTWAERLAEALDAADRRGTGSARSKLADLRAAGGVARTAAGPGRTTLVLQLDPWALDPENCYLFCGWLYLDGALKEKFQPPGASGEHMTLTEVSEALTGILDSVQKRLRDERRAAPDMELEFILPRHLLCSPFDQWKNREADHMRLGFQFPVVVRDLERIRDDALWQHWRKKWDQVLHIGTPAADLFWWVTCADPPYGRNQLFLQLLQEQHVSLGLTFRPVNGVHPFPLAEALDAGTPIAVWPRGCEHGDTPDSAPANGAFREELMRRLGGRPLTDLPHIARDMRIAQARCGTPGPGLTLLWDDPTRCPEPQDFSLRAPEPLGGSS